MSTNNTWVGRPWVGWVCRAGTLLLGVGCSTRIQGLAAINKRPLCGISGQNLGMVPTDTTSGGTVLVWGFVVALAGLARFSATSWPGRFATSVGAESGAWAGSRRFGVGAVLCPRSASPSWSR